MKIRVQRYLVVFRLRLSEWLYGKIVFVSDRSFSLTGSEPPRWAWIEIIGREHYTERHRDVPIVRWSDARRVAAIEARTVPGSFFHVGPLTDGQRRLTFFEANNTASLTEGQAVFRFPETLLLSQSLTVDSLARVVRPNLVFYLSREGSSYKAGGLLVEPAQVAHAMGLKPGWHLQPIEREAPWLLSGLRALPLASWLTAWSPASSRWLREVRAPIVGATVVAVILNLVLASAYIFGTSYWRARELDALGPEVGTLLNAQREVDYLLEQRRAYSEVLRSREAVYPVWGAVSDVWKAGGWLSAVRLSEGVVTLRGRAPSATDVLTALSKNPLVANPSFSAAVRQEGGMQEFAIELRLISKEVGNP